MRKFASYAELRAMGRVRKQRIAAIAMIGIWELFVLHEALAGQPLEKMSAALTRAANNNRPTPGISAPGGRLDLRAPSDNLAAASTPQSFPDPARRKLFSGAGSSTPAPAVASGHIMSPMETMARNYQRQGLPLAKLFENKDSLVHLGLNPKGKPGLWIVHKLH